MQYYIDILNFIAITLLLLTGGVLMKKTRLRKHFLPCAVFCFCVASYLLVKWPPLPKPLFYLLHIPTFSVSFTFWLFSKSIFDDRFKLEKWMGWVLLFVIVFLYTNFYFREQWPTESTAYKISLLIHHIPTLLFTFWAIIEAYTNKDADLLTGRRHFRNVFILTTGIAISIIVMIEIVFVCNAPKIVGLIQVGVIVVLIFYFALRELDVGFNFFNELAIPETTPVKAKSPINKKLINQLIEIIEGQHYYRTEGLTISQLANKLETKEYKLRQAINQHLGFRNFNEFLNSYRIEEACVQLQDKAKKDITIIEIAYDLGYNSLAPFNKAFKQNIGMSPTEFKNSKLNS